MSQIGGENNSMSAKVVQSRSLLPAVIYQPQVYQHNMKLYEPWALHCEVSLINPFLSDWWNIGIYGKLLSRCLFLLRHQEQQQLLLWLSCPQMLHQLDFFFNLSDVRNYEAFQVGKEKTQPPKSAKIQLSNETKVICSLRPLFTLLLSCSSWSRDYLSLFHRMTASLRNYHECTDARTSFD